MRIMVDYVKQFLEKNSIPVTRKSYMGLNWPGADYDKPLPAELEAEIPEELQHEDFKKA
jgi:hypothetical protein